MNMTIGLISGFLINLYVTLNPFRAFLSILGVFSCHPVADGRTTIELQLCPFLTVLTLPFQKNTSCDVPQWGAIG